MSTSPVKAYMSPDGTSCMPAVYYEAMRAQRPHLAADWVKLVGVEVVPEEREPAGPGLGEQAYAKGFNDCREEMLRRINAA